MKKNLDPVFVFFACVAFICIAVLSALTAIVFIK